MPDFQDLAAMNAWREDRCIAPWAHLPHGTRPGTIADVWAAELPSLRRRPSGPDRWRPMGNSGRRWRRRADADTAGLRRLRRETQAGLTALPEAFRRLQQHLLKRPGGDREMVEILALVLHHVLPEACLRHVHSIRDTTLEPMALQWRPVAAHSATAPSAA